MSYATIDNYNNSTATVSIYDLQYPANSYDCFMMYFGNTLMGWRDPTSSSPSREAHVQFDISHTRDGRETAAGWHEVTIFGRYNERDYAIGIRGNSSIHIQPEAPPEDPVRPLTWIKILRFISVEDYDVKIEILTNGYGDVDLVSVTKTWDLYKGYGKTGQYEFIGHDYIREDQVSNGTFQGTVHYQFDQTDLSIFPSVPVGTCHLASGNSLHSNNYDVFSPAFLCMSEYGNWTRYTGTYYTTLQTVNNGFRANVASLSTVKEDWNRLVNMSFYLTATVYGDIAYSTYSSYIPKKGDIITAGMYNALLASVRSCCRELGVNMSLPSHVSSNDIISKDFIYDIGKVVDKCLFIQRDRTNERVRSN